VLLAVKVQTLRKPGAANRAARSRHGHHSGLHGSLPPASATGWQLQGGQQYQATHPVDVPQVLVQQGGLRPAGRIPAAPQEAATSGIRPDRHRHSTVYDRTAISLHRHVAVALRTRFGAADTVNASSQPQAQWAMRSSRHPGMPSPSYRGVSGARPKPTLFRRQDQGIHTRTMLQHQCEANSCTDSRNK
jgi:hypothetical protein